MAAQRAACAAALEGRAAVVEVKAAELRARDAEYVRAVEQHGRDVDALLAKMRADSAAMHARYEVCLYVYMYVYMCVVCSGIHSIRQD